MAEKKRLHTLSVVQHSKRIVSRRPEWKKGKGVGATAVAEPTSTSGSGGVGA